MDNDRIRGQKNRMDSEEEMGVIAEMTGINPTPHALNTESGTSRTGTEVGWRE